jgi:phosphatidylserine/phosphatidylglycerophosphate/cardiolipin synthase-like enzyme
MDNTTEKRLPLVITNDAEQKKVNFIFSYVTEILQSPYIDTLILVGPYISSYFIDLLKRSPVKTILVIIDKNPPKYTMDAIKQLNMFNFDRNNKKEVFIRQRPPKSRFLHMKVMIPYYSRKDIKKFYAPCVIVGSLNLTKNGILYNDELMIILRDKPSIQTCVKKATTLWDSCSKTPPIL